MYVFHVCLMSAPFLLLSCVSQVHCPSSEMVRLFSHLLLLTGDGRLAYHGPMTDALKHFETLGYVIQM